jgi:uncharacterized membrane protein (DUF2068 family)
VDWSLLACGRSGHVTYAPAEPDLREQLKGQVPAGEAWRCLRCASFVPGDPARSGPARDAPKVRRGKEVRSAFILRVFAVERFLRALVFLGLAYGLWRFKYARQSIDATFDRERPIARELFRQLGYNIDNSKLVGLIQHALTLSGKSITLLAAGLAAYAVVEAVEGTGLWLARRWGEYFAMVATSVGLPLEIYDLARKVTATTLVFFLVNLALVLYLVLAKRLFGVRGGLTAYAARLRSESLMEAAIEAAAAEAAGVAGVADATGVAGVADATGAADAGHAVTAGAAAASSLRPAAAAAPDPASGTAGRMPAPADPDTADAAS